jgi:hypothetical protein
MPVAEATLDKYMQEIRKSVCSRCVERPPGGPPCEPLGKNCGIEMHLPELIESIHQVHSNLLEPYLDHNRHAICEKCSFLHSSICPCPMDYLSALVVEAVETVDQRLVRESGKFRLPAPIPQGMAEIQRAYQEGTGTWSGCDWPTKFGKTGLDLQGWYAAEARVMAEKSFPSLDAAMTADWVAAARWLAQVEEHAKQAQACAAAAVSAASDGLWREALQLAQRAWALEFTTGRAIWHSFPLAWRKLASAAEAAYLANEP